MSRWLRALTVLFLTVVLASSVLVPSYASDQAGNPTSVTIAGSLQDELGCAGDWDPACAKTHLTYDENDDVWQASFDVPAGSYEYKAALNDGWDENYGANAAADGTNIALALSDTISVKFFYDHKSHWVTDNVNHVVATAAGSFQAQLGCSDDWDPTCLRSWLQDTDGDGSYTFATSALSAGDYEVKVTINEAWDENYGAEGVANGDNMAFNVPSDNATMLFSYDSATHVLTVSVEESNEGNDNPTSVTIAGSLQDELGCAGDWDPACANSHLTYDENDDVWQGSFEVISGTYEYKAALNGGWDENYGANTAPAGDNIALMLTDTTTVKFYYDHKSHWVTDNVNSVIATAAGSFQAQLGCSGDWDPTCLRSWLQDTNGNGTYSFTTAALSAGDYEVKAAINEGWDENYGQNGEAGGENIAFTVANNNDAVTFSYDAQSHILSVSVQSEADLVQPSLQHAIQDEVLYFLIPDRFNDGDATNNCGDFAGDCVSEDTEANVLTHGYLPNDRGYYHGGDIAGLRAKLDYLSEMGVTTIWVGPIFKNKPVQEDSSNLYGHSSGYHGYWIVDFMNVDPHLGTNEEYKALVQEAHNRGIKVVMDIITNHTADVIKFAEDNYSYRNKTEYPWQDVDGNTFDDLTYAYGGQADYSFPQMDSNGFPYTPVIGEGEPSKNPAWLNDPLNYHNRGNTSFTSENSIYGDFFGLDDLFTAKKEVADGMIDIYKHWVEEYDVDGFRIDTTKHVNMQFWQVFGPEILAAAKADGINDFFAFGEVYDQQYGPSFLSEFSTRGQLQSTIDFAFQMEARNFASKSEATNQLKTLFEQDDYYTDADSNAYAMPTFVGNHDMGRIGYFLKTDNASATDAELLARSKLSHALMFFARGQPVIYYGDEQGFVGDGGDKLARQDMFASTVPEYNDDDLIGTDATTADENFNSDHPIYQALVSYSQVYSNSVALRRGAQIHRYSSDSAGIYAFSRVDRDEKVEYVVALNNATSEQQATVGTYYGADSSFSLVLADGTESAAASLMTDANGQLTLTVPPLGMVIYKADSAIGAASGTPANAPNISISNLTDNQEVVLKQESQDGHTVLERVEVRAELDADVLAEVTFAVKPSTETSYTVIGTDNNAPYRVFYDVSALPEGTTLDFKAIVSDLNGNIKSAQVTGITTKIAEPEAPSATGYAIIHYYREDGDYGDHTTGDYNDYWGLHLWGNAIDDSEGTDWTTPKPFLGEDKYGRFAWVKLKDASQDLNFIIHRGDVKDGTDEDRTFNPGTDGMQIWTKQADGQHYLTQADAQGYVTIRYHRTDGEYGDYTSDDYNDYWGLHLWTGSGDLTSWSAAKKADGQDEYGVYFNVTLAEYPQLRESFQRRDFSQTLNFIVHKGDVKDPADSPDRSFEPSTNANLWLKQDQMMVYTSEAAAGNYAILHYHRPAGDYGDYTSDDANNFWGLHAWGSTTDEPEWTSPIKPAGRDAFGVYFKVNLTENPEQIGYIFHKGDEKDPGPDLFMNFAQVGNEIWQAQGADPNNPLVMPIISPQDPTAISMSGVNASQSGGFTLPLALFAGTLSALSLMAWRRRKARAS